MKITATIAVIVAMSSLVLGAAPEHLGQPVRARMILEGKLIVDRASGKEVLVLSNNNEASGAELVFIDLDADTGRVFRAPAGAGAEALSELSSDRLALGTFYDGSLMIFDLKTMTFVETLSFPGETYIWGYAIGSDGRAYFGSYPGGKLGALDLKSYKIEDLGAGTANKYLRMVAATPDGRILCRFIADNPTWLVFDPGTKRFSPVTEELRKERFAATWSDYVVAGTEAFEGRDLHRAVPRPFPFPPVEKTRVVNRRTGPKPVDSEPEWSVDTFLTTPEALFVRRGSELWRYAKGEAAFKLVTSVNLRGGRILGITRDGRVVGVRGQEYFVIKPGDTNLNLRLIPGPSSPRLISFLKTDRDGCVWGGPPYGQTLFRLDPYTKNLLSTPNITDTGGEVYDLAFVNGVAYAVAYANGEVIRYDPRKPWDEWGQTNPRTIAAIADAGYNRPSGIIVGPGGKLYSGWMAKLGTVGGAVAVTDPVTGKTDLVRDPLGTQSIMGLATDGKLLYVGADRSGTGALPAFANLGIIDPATMKVTWQQEVHGAERVRVVGFDSDTSIVVTIVDSRIRLFDVTKRVFLDRAKDAPPVASWSLGIPGGGKMYYASGHKLIELDLRSGSFETLVEMQGLMNNVAIGPDRSIYFGVSTDLYRFTKSLF